MEWSKLCILLVTVLGFGEFLLKSSQIDDAYSIDLDAYLDAHDKQTWIMEKTLQNDFFYHCSYYVEISLFMLVLTVFIVLVSIKLIFFFWKILELFIC